MAAQIVAVAGGRMLCLALLTLFGAVALTTGLITPIAFCTALAGLGGAAIIPRLSGYSAGFGHTAMILWAVALGAHLVPGFHNLLVLDQVQSGPDSTAFSMYLNLDKPLVLFAVLLAWPNMNTPIAQVRRFPLFVGLILLPLLFATGLATGAVRPEIGLPEWWQVFALANLLLTCLTEEAFFRGYLQSMISSKLGAALGIAAASVLFGLVHWPGGMALVAFASILGAACGLGYYATGRLWVPTLMHFVFNAAHLVFFTYPGPA
ncbi:CPBP family intramembrane glutamic endopeptidase [Ruegeria sp. THAF57]|uniref:CPBP family intramembrane glutamic endopeptidase n=1 Tax=Ruegeria sp. THAF57 TaxID=2744555 RepID=UPI0015E05623|nr:CPBP family intramembrane glutamic endopeptidase [Ruegeria sp. THAF57]